MRVVKKIGRIGLVVAFGAVCLATVGAQEPTPTPPERERLAQAGGTDAAVPGMTKTDDKTALEKTADDPPVGSDDDDAADILNYYSTYLEEYRLGPEDVISVQVFGQCPDYCKEELTIPPTARISYPLIREGIFVGGKTTFEVEDEITKKLNEYIIDPKVTVTLTKVGSARYSVVGKVEKQGAYLMTRKVSVFEAIAESGGIMKEGDKKRAVILRPNAQNKFDPVLVNLKDIGEGKAEMVFLKPGDQLVVGKEGFNLSSILDVFTKASILRILLPF